MPLITLFVNKFLIHHLKHKIFKPLLIEIQNCFSIKEQLFAPRLVHCYLQGQCTKATNGISYDRHDHNRASVTLAGATSVCVEESTSCALFLGRNCGQ